MHGIKQNWTIGGSVLIVAATGLVAVGQDSFAPARDTAVSEGATELPSPSSPAESSRMVQDSQQSATRVMPQPEREPLSATYDATGSIQSIQTNSPQYPPRQRDLFSRFKQRCRAKSWGYPEEFYDPPLGSMVQGFQLTQIAKGQAARMVIYQYDFVPDSAQLNARGKVQLGKILLWLPTNNFPVVVEGTPANPSLDELRRQAVWTELACECLSIPSERVIVGSPNVGGLGALESLLIDRNRMTLTGSRGLSASGTSGTATGSGTSTNSTGTAGTTAR